jgi:hypothetical protein
MGAILICDFRLPPAFIIISAGKIYGLQYSGKQQMVNKKTADGDDHRLSLISAHLKQI